MTRRQTCGLLALSLWSSTAWLTDQFLPSPAPPIAGQGLRLLLVGSLAFLPWLLTGFLQVQRSFKRYCAVAVAGLGLISIPFLLLDLARGRIASTTAVLIFALLPVVFAVLPDGSGESPNALHVLPSAMLGVAGILILLPIPMPGSVLGLLSLAVAMLLTAGCSIWLHRLLGGSSLRIVLPVICLTNGLLLMLAEGRSSLSVFDRSTLGADSLRGLLIDLPETLLLLWLLKKISPQRLSARYLIAPLFTVLEGILILRPRFEVRTLAGIVLLGAGGWFLLRNRDTQQKSVLTLR